MPVLATYFSVRRGRDPFFKFFMKTIFPRQVKEYEEKFGIRFVGWFNVAHGWDFDNVIMFDLPDYATLDKLEADEATRALGHRAGEWIFERHHSMFLRERLGPDLEYHGEGGVRMDLSRNDLLGELASDAALERTDFLVQATEQLHKFLDRNRDRISQLGGLTLVDDDPDYLSIAPDCTFRVRSRYEDPETGEWITDTEVVDTPSELIELYNPAEIFAAFTEAAREAGGLRRRADGDRRAAGSRRHRARGDHRAGRRRRVRGRRRLVGRRPAGGARRGRRGVRCARAVQPRARLPGAEPAERGAPARPVRGGRPRR